MKIKILSREDLVNILEMPAVIEGVRDAYKTKAAGQVAAWPLVEHTFPELNAVCDIRSGGVFGNVGVHGAKLLNNFPLNQDKGLPVFTGLLMVFDSNTGLPQGVMDASYITSMRTGAAAAIGAAALARKDSETLLLLGAGRQSIYLLGAALLEMPGIKRVIVVDLLDSENARNYAAGIRERLKTELGIDTNASFEAMTDLQKACKMADIILTITRSRAPLIRKEWIRPGTHLSCIGADMKGKEEIDPEIFRTARAFADDIRQCLSVGEMEIPHDLGIISEKTVCGEIGQVLSGMVPGRVSENDITVFDATGLAALDLVTAKIAVEAANERSLGTSVEL